MKKLIILIALVIGFSANAQMVHKGNYGSFAVYKQKLSVDLDNGDVRNMLIQIYTKKGYKLRSFYRNKEGKAVLIFDFRGRNIKKFISK